MLADLPPHVQLTVLRVLDAAARRLLTEKVNGDDLQGAHSGDIVAPTATNREELHGLAHQRA